MMNRNVAGIAAIALLSLIGPNAFAMGAKPPEGQKSDFQKGVESIDRTRQGRSGNENVDRQLRDLDRDDRHDRDGKADKSKKDD